MSTQFISCTFPANDHEELGEVESLETASHLMDRLPETGSLLLSMSRNDWLLSNLDLLARGLGVQSLAAFHQVRHIIRAEEIPEVIADVQLLLNEIAKHPDKCASLLNDYGSSTEEIQDDFERSQSILGETSWPEYADDGDKPRYLFSWIKSLLQLLQYAKDNSKCLIHVQPADQRTSEA